jgi:hypothetical protein
MQHGALKSTIVVGMGHDYDLPGISLRHSQSFKPYFEDYVAGDVGLLHFAR